MVIMMRKFWAVTGAVVLAAALSTVTVFAAVNAVKNGFPVYTDGTKVELESYLVEDRTYFQLRDLSEKLGFGLEFKDETIYITTTMPDVPDAEIMIDPAAPLSAGIWQEYRPVALTNVLFIERVDRVEGVVFASTGYFQQPTGEDLYDFGFQFQGLKGDTLRVFNLAGDAAFYFRPCDESPSTTPQRITADVLAAKIAEGYKMWEVQTADGKITSVTNIPWREQPVYKILGLTVSDNMAYVKVQPLTQIRAPFLLGNHRFDETGLSAETIAVTPVTKILAVDLDSPNAGEKAVDLATFAEVFGGGGRYVQIAKNGAKALEIREIFVP
jgi:hypothetical protein